MVIFSPIGQGQILFSIRHGQILVSNRARSNSVSNMARSIVVSNSARSNVGLKYCSVKCVLQVGKLNLFSYRASSICSSIGQAQVVFQ